MTAPRPRPTPAEVAAAAGRTIADVIAPDLAILFCGINPGLYSGATGHHFARPGNRFWPALRDAGLTDGLLSPGDREQLLAHRLGVTNLVARATATAAELAPDELRQGRRRLAAKARRWRPRCVAVLGIGAYRTAFDQPQAGYGLQPERLAGAAVWVLPNPSGLNAHYQRADLAQAFVALRQFAVPGARPA